MKRNLLRTLCPCFLLATAIAVIMEPKSEIPVELADEDEVGGFDEALGVCLARKEYDTLECVNRGALSALQSLNGKDELDFGDVHLQRASGQNRELLDLDYDPKDIGNLLTAGARLMEQRSLRWDLGALYPGLLMQVGPTLTGHGVLEFTMDERAAAYGAVREGGTGRTLVKNLLLPFLLGFKFNLASLIPLLFGALLIISKKAFVLAKVAVILSGLFGWGSLFGGGNRVQPYAPVAVNGLGTYGFGHGHDHDHGGTLGYHEPGTVYRPYRDYTPYDQHVIRETVNVYEGDGAANDGERTARQSKNFAWTKSN